MTYQKDHLLFSHSLYMHWFGESHGSYPFLAYSADDRASYFFSLVGLRPDVLHSGFPGGTSVKELACQCQQHKKCQQGRSLGGGHGNPLQYSCLENSMDRRAWQPTVHGVTKSQTQLRDWARMHTRITFVRGNLGKIWKLIQFRRLSVRKRIQNWIWKSFFWNKERNYKSWQIAQTSQHLEK